MIKAIVIYLIRKRLGLKKFEKFKFSNQKTDDVYFFGKYRLLVLRGGKEPKEKANVSLNWLLSDKCKIEKV